MSDGSLLLQRQLLSEIGNLRDPLAYALLSETLTDGATIRLRVPGEELGLGR